MGGGGGCPEVHLISEAPICKIKMAHFASILVPLLQKKPCSLNGVDLGAMHGDLGLSDFCEGSD